MGIVSAFIVSINSKIRIRKCLTAYPTQWMKFVLGHLLEKNRQAWLGVYIWKKISFVVCWIHNFLGLKAQSRMRESLICISRNYKSQDLDYNFHTCQIVLSKKVTNPTNYKSYFSRKKSTTCLPIPFHKMIKYKFSSIVKCMSPSIF